MKDFYLICEEEWYVYEVFFTARTCIINNPKFNNLFIP